MVSKAIAKTIWDEMLPPFYWVVLSRSYAYDERVHTYLNENIAGWYYRDGDVVYMGDETDFTLFQIWLHSL